MMKLKKAILIFTIIIFFTLCNINTVFATQIPVAFNQIRSDRLNNINVESITYLNPDSSYSYEMIFSTADQTKPGKIVCNTDTGTSLYSSILENTEYTITIENGIEEIGYNSFKCQKNVIGLNLKDSDIKKIGDFAFFETSLKEVILPKTCEEIGDCSFNSCINLDTIQLNEGLKKIGTNAFGGTNIKEIRLPNTLETLGSYAFDKCDNLEKIIVSKDQTQIIDQLIIDGYGDKTKIIGDTYIENNQLYDNNELVLNSKYILIYNESIEHAIDSEIIIDREHENMTEDEYLTYLIQNEPEDSDYYVCTTNEYGIIQIITKKSEYTGFYNGQAYKNGKILKDSLIALPIGTSINTNSNEYTEYLIVTEEDLKENDKFDKDYDVYYIDEEGKIIFFLNIGSGILTGDVNLDGIINITDIIYLNKYIVGTIRFNSDQLRAADCYQDNIINSADLMALLRLVVGFEKKLPILEVEQDEKNNFINTINDEFHNKYIKITNSHLEFVQIADIIHNKIANSAKNEENKMQYGNEYVYLKDIYVNENFGPIINSKAFVSFCLYQYAIHTQNEELLNYIIENQDLYNISKETLNELGWEKIEYTNKNQLLIGDIVISENEYQIFNSYMVYSCGSDEQIRSSAAPLTIEPGNGNYIIRIEPTSGKCGEDIEWNIEDGTLNIEGSGDMYEDLENNIPWKASMNKINTIVLGVSNQQNVSRNVGNTMEHVNHTKVLRIKNIGNGNLVKMVKILKEEILYRKCVVSDYRLDGNDMIVTLEGAYMRGIDVSKHNGDIDWEKVKNDDIDFAILRIGYGRELYQKDEKFDQNFVGAIRAGIDVGIYHFSYAKSVEGINAEIDTLLSWLQNIDPKQLRLPIFIDFEAEGVGYLDSETLTAMANVYCIRMKEAGYNNIGIYTGPAWFEEKRIDLSKLPKSLITWVARYIDSPEYMDHRYENQYDIWQYISKGDIDGISANVDMNILYTKRALTW